MLFNALPDYVREVLARFKEAHKTVYLVGGCVRDQLSGTSPDDFDFVTDAVPEEVLGIFPRAIPTGLKHGTVTVVVDGVNMEVTTMRRDGRYDGRRPDAVYFSSDITEDLSRRDFTINAMAWSPDDGLIDPYGGREDIARRVVRCVGEPRLRFTEDALRMFRAIRFAARLEFDIAPDTDMAIGEMSGTADILSGERVYVEIVKTLSSPRPQMIAHMLDYSLLDSYCVERKPCPRLDKLAYITAQWRFAALYHIFTEDGIWDETALDSLHVSKAERKSTLQIHGAALVSDMTDISIKRLITKYGAPNVHAAAEICDALYGGNRTATISRIRDMGECTGLAMLKVSGSDIKKLGYSGKEIGQILERLLEHVYACPADNEKEKLIAMVQDNPNEY